MYKESERAKMLETMLQKGVHFGHKKSKWNPHIGPYVYGVRNNTYIIDLNKTFDMFNAALDYLAQLKKEGKTVLIIGLKTQSVDIVRELGKKVSMPFVASRWVGGTLTNFPEISKRIKYFLDLEKKREQGELAKYTKRERVMFDKEIVTLERKWGGIKHMSKLPDALLLLDSTEKQAIINEAKEAKIPVVAIVDTNTDPKPIDYPIPANDDSISSLQFLSGEIAKALTT